MALSGGALAALLIGGGAATVATVAIVRANQAGESAGASGAEAQGGAGGFLDGSGALDGFGLGSTEPPALSGAGLDAFGETVIDGVPTVLPASPGVNVPPVNVGQVKLDLSRTAERQLLRDSKARVNSARLDNAVNTALLGGFAVSAVKKGLSNPAIQRAVRLSPVASRVAAGARLATPVAAGAGLGILGVRGLDKAGVLDAASRASSRAGNALNKTAVGRVAATAVKSAALPVSVVGAVAHGAATKATVAGNLRQAYRGTVVQKGASAVGRAFRKVF